LGLTWDDLELQYFGPGPFRHVALFAGDLHHAFPFRYATTGRAAQLRDGLFARPRKAAVYFGKRHWGGKRGTLVLAPGYPSGGERGDHLIFRWSRGGVDYAIGLHAREPLTQAAATLKAIVASTP
jgi:hypothetical protein